MVGKPAELVKLLLSRHLQPQGDTSIAGLAAIAREHGLQSKVFSELPLSQLWQATPCILHIRGSRYSARPDHYIVCLSIQGNDALIFNPPATEKTVPLESLAARWKGQALLLSASGTNLDVFEQRAPASHTSDRFSMALLAAAITGIVALRVLRIRFFKRNAYATSGKLRRIACQITGLVLGAVVLGYGSRSLLSQEWALPKVTHEPLAPTISSSAEDSDPLDFLPRASLDSTPAGTFIEVDFEEALSLHSTGALFVDARDSGEFGEAHIKGALHCPASDVIHARLYMAGIPRNRKIVVYCSDAHCGKAHEVARALVQYGYTQVAHYRDGWSKWTGPKVTR